VVSGRGCEARVARDQRGIKHFGEGEEGGVVGGEVVAELPDAVAEGVVWVAREREVGEVGSSVGGALLVQLAPGGHAAQGVEDLDVDQMGCVQVAVTREAFDQPGRRLAGDQRRQRGRGIDDEHRAVSCGRGRREPRRRSRQRLRRRHESGRVRKTRWTLSGTLRIWPTDRTPVG
jgi:hypothetical protein